MPPVGGARQPFLRHLEAARYFENFFICAVVSIVALRTYLALTGYPQVGGNGLHIAHMLWGSFLMLTAICILLGFLNTRARPLAAMLAGIGFGLFIDELGKFITSDNNYFFRPTVALIYVIFVVVYAALVAIGRRTYTPAEYLTNALEVLKDAAIRDLDAHEKERALHYLAHAAPHDALAGGVAALLERVQPVAETESAIAAGRRTLAGLYHAVIDNKWMVRAAVAVLVLNALLYVNAALLVLVGVVAILVLHLHGPRITVPADGGLIEGGNALSAALAAFLAVLGGVRLARSRLSALQFFRYALLVNIFLVQFFVFYQEQLAALPGLLLNIGFLKSVDYARAQEARRVTAGRG